MNFPLKLAKRVSIKKGPVLLGQPVLGPDAIFVGRSQIHRIDAEGLKTAWSKKYESCIAGRVIDRLLLVGNGWNQLKALDTNSGEVVWSHSSAGGSLWRGQILTFESDHIGVLDPLTGKLLDRIDFPGSFVRDLKDDIILYDKDEGASASGAYDLEHRKILWERPLLEETIKHYQAPGESMTLAAGTKAFVLTKTDVGIFGCSMEDGRILWHHRAFVSHDVPFAADGRVYALTRGLPTRNEFAKFMCFDELSGEKIYETEHKQFLAYRPSRPTVFEDYVAFGSQGGFVFAFRLSDGELVWCHRTTGSTWQPAFGHDRLYATSDDGHLLVFEGKRPSRSRSR